MAFGDKEDFQQELASVRKDLDYIRTKLADDGRMLTNIDKALGTFLAKHEEQEKRFIILEEKVGANCKAFQSHTVDFVGVKKDLRGYSKWIKRLEEHCKNTCKTVDEEIEVYKDEFSAELKEVRIIVDKTRFIILYGSVGALLAWIAAQWSIITFYHP